MDILLDGLYLLLTLGFFAITWGLVWLCERLEVK